MGQLLISLVIALIYFACLSSGQIVNTTGGLVEGTNGTSRNGRSFSAFKGIPYAEPPVGKLRFQSPVPAKPWSGIRDAKSYGAVCPQIVYDPFGLYEIAGEEDCLSINVFSNKNFSLPELDNQELLPVLVFLHGGYFMALSGSYFGPDYLLDHDTLLVTFNYRLAALGFLSTQDENAPGNAGIKDQVLALKWIQDNIASFGGDPNRVTIYGESAGAAAVQYHLVSDASKGLFSAAISGSGTAFKIYSYQVNPLNGAQVIANQVGCGEFADNSTAMVECLQSVNASAIAEISGEFLEVVKDPLTLFCPSKEDESYSTDPFLTRHPYETLKSGDQQRLPWLVGVNSAEGLVISSNILKNEEWIPRINSDWVDNLAPQFLLYNEGYTNWTEAISDSYLSAYRMNGSINFRQDLMDFTNMFTDRYYVQASLDAAKTQAQYSPTFFYYNDYMTASNPLGLGVTHGEEMSLLFYPFMGLPNIGKGHPDFEQSVKMVDLIVQFVTNPYEVIYDGQLWEPIDPSADEGEINSFIFKNSNRGQQGVSVLPRTLTDRVRFWKNNNIPPYEQV